MAWAPILAVVLRHARMWRRDPNFLLSSFYWPILDVLIWGFLGTWIQQSQNTGFHNYEVVTLSGVLLWAVVGRGANIIGISFAEELWSHNVVNLFSLPLRTHEWISGIVIYNGLMMTMTSLFSMVLIYLLYDVSLWYVFSTFLIFLPPLFLSGIWLGFTNLQIVVTLGKRGVELGFVAAWFLMPFSGAFYPVDVLPRWGQMLSACLPMSYVFTGMRNYLMHQQDPTSYLIKGYALSILYALCAVFLFIYLFNRSKRNGLARLAD